jgi:lactoylglutathione lyase
MIIDHIAIYTNQLEVLKNYYIKYFEGVSNNIYINEKKQFRSYFLSFKSGARLEIMSLPGIPDNANDTIDKQYKGIIHLAFGAETMNEVDEKANQLRNDGFKILDGPRKTGDGYYEFVTLDPDLNRIEVTTDYIESSFN